MFKMTLNHIESVMLISYSGVFTVYDAKLLLRDLQSKIKMIRPEDYTLVIDMQEIRPSTPELLPLLEEIKNVYMEAPFKFVYCVASDALMTLKAKKKEESPKRNWFTVQTVDEALKLVKDSLQHRGNCKADQTV